MQIEFLDVYWSGPDNYWVIPEKCSELNLDRINYMGSEKNQDSEVRTASAYHFCK